MRLFTCDRNFVPSFERGGGCELGVRHVKGTDHALAKLELPSFLLSVCNLTLTSALHHRTCLHQDHNMESQAAAMMADLGQDRRNIATAPQWQRFDLDQTKRTANVTLAALQEAPRKNLVNILAQQHRDDDISEGEWHTPENVNDILFRIVDIAESLKRAGHCVRGWDNIMIRQGREKRLLSAPGTKRIKDILHPFHEEMYQDLVAECLGSRGPRRNGAQVSGTVDLRAQLLKERKNSRWEIEGLKERLLEAEALVEEQMAAKLRANELCDSSYTYFKDQLKRVERAEQTINEMPASSLIGIAVTDLAKENKELKEAVKSSEEKLDKMMGLLKVQDSKFEAMEEQGRNSERSLHAEIANIARSLERLSHDRGCRSPDFDGNFDSDADQGRAPRLNQGRPSLLRALASGRGRREWKECHVTPAEPDARSSQSAEDDGGVPTFEENVSYDIHGSTAPEGVRMSNHRDGSSGSRSRSSVRGRSLPIRESRGSRSREPDVQLDGSHEGNQGTSTSEWIIQVSNARNGSGWWLRHRVEDDE